MRHFRGRRQHLNGTPAGHPRYRHSFAPYTATSRDTLITADAALAAAQATGIMADAWTQGTPTAALVSYTNTLDRTFVDVPAWVITATGTAHFHSGPYSPRGHPTPRHEYTRLTEWIIDATTGTCVGAPSRGV